ncbi:MAG: hypothetical protein E7148_00210 [Rikenellaceae bacterium]|nr:hypothetical protein [Rikenellaceae bacterium]
MQSDRRGSVSYDRIGVGSGHYCIEQQHGRRNSSEGDRGHQLGGKVQKMDVSRWPDLCHCYGKDFCDQVPERGKQTFNAPQATAAPAQVQAQNPQPRNYYSQNTQPVQTPVIKEKKAKSRYKPHFEGGINLGYALGLEDGYRVDYDGGYDYDVSSVSTDAIVAEITAGCRINPYVFVGGTTGIYYYYDMSAYVIPILPTAKLGYPINQKWSVYAEVGLGVGIGVGDYSSSAEFMYKVGPMFKVNNFNFGFHYSSPAEGLSNIAFKFGWTF